MQRANIGAHAIVRTHKSVLCAVSGRGVHNFATRKSVCMATCVAFSLVHSRLSEVTDNIKYKFFL